MASSGAPSLSAAKEAANSGSDVLKAKNCVPIKLFSQPMASERWSPTMASQIAAATTMAAASR